MKKSGTGPLFGGNQVFSTSEGILAFCLYLAGAEFADDRAPCFNLYDPDILEGFGFAKGEKLWPAAQEAWRGKMRGHVEYSFILSQRTHDLIKIYREQCEALKAGEGKTPESEQVISISSALSKGEMLQDEATVRMACIILKVRSEFMNMWKKCVPILRIPRKGTTKRFKTTAQTTTPKGAAITVPAIGISKPGFDMISLNATDEARKAMKL